ncbi:MAG: DEAD/DEAH box helicase [Arachnia sp.]
MDREHRQQIRANRDELADWVHQAHSIVNHRAKTAKVARSAASILSTAVVDIRIGDKLGWRALPLRQTDRKLLNHVALLHNQPSLTSGDEELLERLNTEVDASLDGVKALVGFRRFFSGSGTRATGQAHAEFLTNYRDWGLSAGVPQFLERMDQSRSTAQVEVDTRQALTEHVGLSTVLPELDASTAMTPLHAVADLPAAIKIIDGAIRGEARFRAEVVSAGNAVRKREVGRLVSEMPVERLKDATRDRLRVGALTTAGINTVQDVMKFGPGLEHLPGIGATTATRMRGAAQTLWQSTYDEMPVRIDIKQRTAEATELLRSLYTWDAMRKTAAASSDLARAAALTSLAAALDPAVTDLVVAPVGSSVADFHDAVDAVVRRARLISGTTSAWSAVDPWADFLARPADYYAMLAELGFIPEDEGKAHGDLPDAIVEAVRNFALNTEFLTVNLRGYQRFGACFALVQRKVIIGDEMGLGKTIEALAVLAHLRSTGSHHSLVICPAAVVTNWVREVQSKSTLRAHRAHGPDREAAVRSWAQQGGVAVTTFESLGWFQNKITAVRDLGCVVVDEAHYIKNPSALRTERTAQVLASCDRAVLMTGTPMENRIGEFANLASYLRPDLRLDPNELAPRRFRKQVAPVYLRRNQEDVLIELPELVEIDEWVPMSAEDTAIYRDAVAAGNFMGMRQAAMRSGTRSEKLQRLIEIVEEAEANGRRVIVFSFFRDTLDQVVRALPGKVFGPLNGSVPSEMRQRMIDQFSTAGHGAVLVSQILAGGVGLNIQAASVVVICEPQLKPTTEWQAIARARRMGQLLTVQVHRLLSEDGVDQRITEILARKSALFADFARISDTAASAPEALDISEGDLIREVLAKERERLFATPSTILGAESESTVPKP